MLKMAQCLHNFNPLFLPVVIGELLCCSTCRICPIFAISCVNGRNIDLLLKFLNALPPLSNGSEKEKIVQALTEHQARCCFVLVYCLIFHAGRLNVLHSDVELWLAGLSLVHFCVFFDVRVVQFVYFMVSWYFCIFSFLYQCKERLFSELTYYALSGTLNSYLHIGTL